MDTVGAEIGGLVIPIPAGIMGMDPVSFVFAQVLQQVGAHSTVACGED